MLQGSSYLPPRQVEELVKILNQLICLLFSTAQALSHRQSSPFSGSQTGCMNDVFVEVHSSDRMAEATDIPFALFANFLNRVSYAGAHVG